MPPIGLARRKGLAGSRLRFNKFAATFPRFNECAGLIENQNLNVF
jgi:hypothetical protein